MTADAAALELHDSGWHPVTVPCGKKHPREKGRTGYKGRNRTRSDVETHDWSHSSIGVRMPPDVVGIDLDVYNGGDLGPLEAKHGPLPSTVMTTARTDGSGIGFYRVPVGTMLTTAIPPGIEIIQWFHRIAMVAPSINPKVSAPYRWIEQQSGEIRDTPPEIDDLPDLPWAWIEALSVSGKGKHADRAATPDELLDFIDAHTESLKPSALRGISSKLAPITEGGRHDSLVKTACWVFREARAGLYPAADAVELLEGWWNSVTDGRDDEFVSALLWGLAEAEAEPQERIDEIRSKSTPEADQGKPELVVSGRHLNEITDELVDLLVEQNDPPRLFAHAEGVSALDTHKLHPLDTDRLLNETEQRVRPMRVLKDGEKKPATVSSDVRKLTLMRMPGLLPGLVGLATAPFMRPDGTICQTAGYDEATELYLLDALAVEVPESPTEANICAAVALIDDWLHDFPLPTDTDRAHAFSLLLTPTVRHLVPLAPMHYVNGNMPGTGKNLLAETALSIHLGERVQTDPLPRDEEEMRKQITSMLAEGRRVVLWDEAHYLIGAQLARLPTSVQWGDRLLGSNVTINARNLMSTVALANNGEIVGDIRRRVVQLRLETDLEQPSLRSGFRHPDLRVWTEAHRSEMLESILTLLRAWHVAGRPGVESPMGSFEDWTNIIGGTLEVAGVDGFLGNVTEVLEEGDSLDAEFAGHLADLTDTFLFPHGREFAVGDVLRAFRDDWQLELPSGIRPHADDAAERLGKLYRRYKSRPMPGGLKLEKAGSTHGRARWRVTNLGGGATGGDRWGSTNPTTHKNPDKSGGALPIETEKGSCEGIAIPTHPHPSHPDGVPPTNAVDHRPSRTWEQTKEQDE
jgi:hypothetical protein